MNGTGITIGLDRMQYAERRNIVLPNATTRISTTSVVVSSFSSGILYSHAFRAIAAGMPAGLGEIWDLDGSLSSISQYSADLRHGQSVPVVQYDQNAALGTSSYHLPTALGGFLRSFRRA